MFFSYNMNVETAGLIFATLITGILEFLALYLRHKSPNLSAFMQIIPVKLIVFFGTLILYKEKNMKSETLKILKPLALEYAIFAIIIYCGALFLEHILF